ncbi:unnamed protein product [Ectocarpus fasciculatus]
MHKDSSPTTAVQQQRHGRGQVSPMLARPASQLLCIASSTSTLGVAGVQPPVELEDDGQEPWLALGAGRVLQRVPYGVIQRATADWEPSCPPAVSGRHRLSRHG